MKISRALCYVVVVIRFGFTVGFLVAPTAMMTHLFGDAGHGGLARGIAIAYGIRDLALGIGLYRALRTRRYPRAWMLAGTIADLADLCAVAWFVGGPPPGRGSLLVSMTAIVLIDAVLTATVAGRSGAGRESRPVGPAG